MRKHIFPSLMQAYNHWCGNHDIAAIDKMVNSSLQHWKNIAAQMLVLHQQDSQHCSVTIEALVNENHL